MGTTCICDNTQNILMMIGINNQVPFCIIVRPILPEEKRQKMLMAFQRLIDFIFSYRVHCVCPQGGRGGGGVQRFKQVVRLHGMKIGGCIILKASIWTSYSLDRQAGRAVCQTTQQYSSTERTRATQIATRSAAQTPPLPSRLRTVFLFLQFQ